MDSNVIFLLILVLILTPVIALGVHLWVNNHEGVDEAPLDGDTAEFDVPDERDFEIEPVALPPDTPHLEILVQNGVETVEELYVLEADEGVESIDQIGAVRSERLREWMFGSVA